MSGTGPVVFTFGTPDFTGANQMAFRYMLALREAGIPVAAVCGEAGGNSGSVAEELEAGGVAFEIMPGWNRLLDRALLARLTSHLRAHSARAVASFLQLDVKIAGWAARSAGIPFFACAQNTVTFGGSPPVRLLKRLAYRQSLLRCASRVFCCSQAVMEEYAGRFRLPSRLLLLLPNRIDPSRFGRIGPDGRARLRRELGVPEGVRMVVNVGRIDKQKGQDILLDALPEGGAKALGASLFFVGGVSAADEGAAFHTRISGRVEKAGGVRLLGWRSDVESVLAAADLYVHPSRWEGLPLAVLEAMASRLPVIYSDCAGTIEGFEDGVHGMCVPSGDVPALRSALAALLGKTDEQLAGMGGAARRLVEDRHDFAQSARVFIAEVLAGIGASRPPSAQGNA